MSVAAGRSAELRIDWVDAAKGICIIFVVMMHATLGVELAMDERGWMHDVVQFARPFRMPDFFLISGLFLGLVIDRPWLRYIDRKVVHFAYFYVLWLTIQFAFKAPGMAAEQGAAATFVDYLVAFVQPFGTLWFIYILPVFFVFTRLVKRLPVWLVLGFAAILEMLPIHTGILVFDEFCSRFVYFFVGYAFADLIFRMAGWARAHVAATLVFMTAWGVVNAILAFAPVPAGTAHLLDPTAYGVLAELPVISLLLGVAGAMAIVFSASLVTIHGGYRWLTWLGAHSIVVYLAFFLPMAIARAILIRTGIITDVGTISLLVLIAAVIGPVIGYLIIRRIGFGMFLFERPAWARIDGARASDKRLAPAE